MRYIKTAVLFCYLFPLVGKAQTVKEYTMETLFQLDEADIPLYKPDVKYKQVVASAHYYKSDGHLALEDSLITKLDTCGRFVYIQSVMPLGSQTRVSSSTFSYANNTVSVENGRNINSGPKEIYELDAKGRILTKSSLQAVGTRILDRHVSYTHNGRISYLHSTRDGGIVEKKVYQLTKKGKVEKCEEYGRDTTVVNKAIDYTYNEKDQLIFMVTKFKGMMGGGIPYTFTYNEKGLIASLKKGDMAGFTYTYVYDATGEWTRMECQLNGEKYFYVNRSYIR
ncbi:hypothetical protein SAMN05428988_4950 [Chitinophaga sp. YR573]|uniref:hypothetical protein n=1 Tax=Chitinophaga sp. YR573 TaxID=1881040 RepID=UPI0008C83274|nr:hypothetical protein [Chitinophaga sp. YR573]SEW38927.1 hypothetical protein SAMN05428988_4950 [Chitinophaga sp. YR573]